MWIENYLVQIEVKFLFKKSESIRFSKFTKLFFICGCQVGITNLGPLCHYQVFLFLTLDQIRGHLVIRCETSTQQTLGRCQGNTALAWPIKHVFWCKTHCLEHQKSTGQILLRIHFLLDLQQGVLWTLLTFKQNVTLLLHSS